MKRLIAVSAQLTAMETGATLLIDEVEHGLEPHRIRNLLRQFKSWVSDQQEGGQIIMTSHSPTVLVELKSNQLSVVRSSDGCTEIKQLSSELQGLVRAVPEAFLGAQVILCEGKTEYGLCIGIEEYWKEVENKLPFAHQGTAIVEGGGDSTAARALELSRLGYRTCVLIDGDKLDQLNPSVDELCSNGVEVVFWSDGACTEERICADMSWDAIVRMFNLAVRLHGEDKIIGKLSAVLEIERRKVSSDLDQWLILGFEREEIRCGLAKSAKEKSWFKRTDRGKALGKVLARDLENCRDKDVAIKINQLREWAYGH